jgi:prepilin-type N-terminal cleavage/methylation domain-containing protein/prepilin-type processing-associated H-X9-DG protein
MTAQLREPRRSLVARAARKAGFTLIELLAVILIIGVLATFLLPKIPEAIDQARVTACQANLREIYKGLLSYQVSHKRLPKKENSGVRFFAVLIAKGEWENTESSANKLTCPGVDIGFLECGDLPPDEWYIDLDLVNGGYSTYAGRDTMSHPLRKLESGKEALVADDNDPEMNHRQATNVLFGDGNVKSFILSDLVDEGLIDREAGHLSVGPESPVEELQKLSLD